jgi:hypothetical protein
VRLVCLGDLHAVWFPAMHPPPWSVVLVPAAGPAAVPAYYDGAGPPIVTRRARCAACHIPGPGPVLACDPCHGHPAWRPGNGGGLMSHTMENAPAAATPLARQ